MANCHKQGDIYFANLISEDGSIQKGSRPVVILQNNVGNKYSPTVTVVPLTSKRKSMYMPTHALIEVDKENGLRHDSIALGEQITTIPVKYIGKRIGRLKNEDLHKTWTAALNQIALSNIG